MTQMGDNQEMALTALGPTSRRWWQHLDCGCVIDSNGHKAEERPYAFHCPDCGFILYFYTVNIDRCLCNLESQREAPNIHPVATGHIRTAKGNCKGSTWEKIGLVG